MGDSSERQVYQQTNKTTANLKIVVA